MALIKANGMPNSTEESYMEDGYEVVRSRFEALETTTTPNPAKRPARYPVDEEKKLYIRLGTFIFSLILLYFGHGTIPDNSPTCVKDFVMDWLQGANDWVLANPYWRDVLQIACSLFMDGMFLSLGVFWIFKGKSSRLIVSVTLFYAIRAMVQSVFWLPYTKGYWWFNPGFPSLVVPYGRGSDFFFSGHVGFVTICAYEWHMYGKKLMVYLLTLGGIYTGFILVIYQVHYCIDIFTGFIFAHWLFMMVDKYKDHIDNFLMKIFWDTSVIARKLSDM